MSNTITAGGPPAPPAKGATPEEMLKAQNDSQAYWFGINAQQNTMKQNNESQSNLQKAQADSLDAMIRNIKP